MAIDIAGSINTMLTVLIWMIGIGTIGVIGGFIYFNSKYNITVVIKDVRNGMKRATVDKARIVDRKGAKYWKLQKIKKEIIPPPEESIELTRKGKDFAMLYRVDDDTFIPIKDGFSWEETLEDEEFMDKFRPLPTNQKAALINQYKKVERDKAQNMHDLISKAIPFVAMILIMVCFMIFFGDVVEPSNELASTVNTGISKMDAVITKLDATINDKQIIFSNNKMEVNNSEIPN